MDDDILTNKNVRVDAISEDIPEDAMYEDAEQEAMAQEDDEELSAEELSEIESIQVPEMVIAGDEEHDDPLSEAYVLEEEAVISQPKKDPRSRYKIASAKEFFNTEILYRYDLLEESEREVIKGRYRIELKGFQGGIWTVEAGQELTVANRSGEADVVLGMQQKDFLDLINGGLNPQLAMLSQKIKVVGDIKKAVFFQSVLAPLFSLIMVMFLAFFSVSSASADSECFEAAELVQKGVAMSDGSPEEEELYTNAIDKCQGLVEAYYNLALNQIKQGKLNVANSNLDKALNLNKKSNFYLAKANIYILQDKQDQAFEFFNKVIEIEPKNSKAYHGLAAVYDRRNDYASAESAFRQAIQHNPHDPVLFYNLGLILNKLGQWDEALVSFKTAVDKNPNYHEAVLHLGQALLLQKRYEEAERVFSQAANKTPEDISLKILLADIAEKMGDKRKARSILEAELAKDPNNYLLLTNYGILLVKLGELDNAVAKLEEAKNKEPRNHLAFNALGYAYIKRKSYDAAQSTLITSIELNPNNAYAYNNLGVIYEIKKDKERALESFNKARELAPSLKEAELNLQRLTAK